MSLLGGPFGRSSLLVVAAGHAFVVPRVFCDWHGILSRGDSRAGSPGEYLGEFRAEKQNHRRIINPKQNHDKRSCRAVSRGGAGTAQITAEQKFPRREEKG